MEHATTARQRRGATPGASEDAVDATRGGTEETVASVEVRM